MMSDRSNATTNSPQIDSRANLVYFFQKLSGLAEARDRKSGKEAPVSNDQTDTLAFASGPTPESSAVLSSHTGDVETCDAYNLIEIGHSAGMTTDTFK